jgi:DNA-binding LacI/PurR family transcriptional regulator
VLRDPETTRASDKTKAAIFKASKALGYRGHILASRLRQGTKGLALVICAESPEMIYYPYYQEIIAGIHQALGASGLSLSTHFFSNQTKEHILKNLDHSLYGGLIILGDQKYPEIEELAKTIPTLQINYLIPSDYRHYLLRDEVQSAKLIFSHLSAKGKNKITGIFFNRTETQSYRAKIYQKVAKEFPGLQLRIECFDETETLMTLEKTQKFYDSLGETRLKSLIADAQAVISFSTYGEILYRKLLQIKIRIPQDLSFLMDGTTYVERAYFPEVTRFGPHFSEMVEMILSFFDSEQKATKNETRTFYYPTHLIPGQTG